MVVAGQNGMELDVGQIAGRAKIPVIGAGGIFNPIDAREFIAAGAKAVYLAGRQKDEGPWRAAGVDGFIFAGADMIATLKDLHGKIGV